MAETGVIELAKRLRRGPLRRFKPFWSALRAQYYRARAVRRGVITAWRRITYAAKPGAPSQVHLSWADDPATSFTVTWHTPGIESAVQVSCREAGAPAWKQVPATSTRSPGVGGRLHRATVTGLQPDTVYEYVPTGDSGAQVPEVVFKTRTAPPSGPADFAFVFLCDTGLVGRPDGRTAAAQPIIDHIVRDTPLFLIGGGDYAYANRDPRFPARGDAVDAWFRQMEPLLSHVPIMAQYGNHEIYLEERFEDWAPRFAHPPGHDSGRNYSFAIGDVHFTALFVPGGIPPEADQLAWLDADLAAARRGGARWLIVFQHGPIYSHGHSHPANPIVRAALVPVLLKHKVDLHLSGHDQNYERTFPLTGDPHDPTVTNRALNDYRSGEGVIYAKVGPGGKISDVRNDFSRFTTPQQDYMAVRDDTAHHYALFRVRARGELEMETYSLDKTGTQKRVLDRFRIVAP